MTEDQEKLLDDAEEILDDTPDVDTQIKEERSGIQNDGPDNSGPSEVQVVEQVNEKPAQKQVAALSQTATTEFMNPNVYKQIMVMSKHFAQSKALPQGFANEFQVLVAMQAGYEMGMKPFESIQSLYFVNGSLNIWGKATVKRLRDHGWSIRYFDESDRSVSVEIKKGTEKYSETYTFEEAEKSGYTTDRYGKTKVGWREGLNRKLKLRYGVLSLIIKSYVPEVMGSANNIVEVHEDAQVTTTQENNLPTPEKIEIKPGKISQKLNDKLGSLQ